jgi:hypothetical protein
MKEAEGEAASGEPQNIIYDRFNAFLTVNPILSLAQRPARIS